MARSARVMDSVVRDPAQAEEVTQEAFLEIWRTASRFDPGRGSPLAWMLTITHRKAVDRVRSAESASRRDVSYEQQNQPVAHDGARPEAVGAHPSGPVAEPRIPHERPVLVDPVRLPEHDHAVRAAQVGRRLHGTDPLGAVRGLVAHRHAAQHHGRRGVRALARHDGAMPTRRYSLFEVDGTLTFFGGCGWDAQILDDYRSQMLASPSSRIAKSVWGYLTAMLTRTVPKVLVKGRPHVMIENLGDEVYVIDEGRRLTKLEGARRGTILYEGMASVAGAATCPEFGYGFKAYPFAERLLDWLNIRIYDQKALSAVKDIPKLWRGDHPLRGMHDWFASEVRMTFSRPVPLQIGGEAVGLRTTVEFKRSARRVDALDWRMLG